MYLKNLIIIIFFTLPLYAQISPGDLTAVHANLEGLGNCTKCHEIGEKVQVSKCLDCHSEIKTLINSNKGYHSNSGVKNKNCWGCHNEHHGRNFKIINLIEDEFDHAKTGFGLSGSHSKKDCKDCHQSKFISDSKFKKKSKTFLGLSQACISCHADYHQKTLGTDCANCHSTEKFKPASKFDHNKAEFKLLGAHEKVECSKCHPTEKRNGKDFTKLKGLNFNNCSSCHSDIHKGAFGADCKSCHSVNSFHIINQQNFDHSKTKFPLIGKHQKVRCTDCHKGGVKKKPLFAKCIDCHSDFHRGDFTKDNLLKDCRTCHKEQGFSPSMFSIDDHNKSKFKLTGSHLAVPCFKCHYKEKKWKFKNMGMVCINCHQNVHGKELSEKFLPENKCESCHQTKDWNTINFDHNSTKFVLLGKHKNVNCGNCHYKQTSENIKVFKFSSLGRECEKCHKDNHFGQFDVEGVNDCSRCHEFDDWKPVSFDHNKTKFILDGAHIKVNCEKCHKTVNQNGKSYKLFKLKDFKCASCHSK